MADNTITKTTETANSGIYEINPSILQGPMGYSAQIDGDNIMVVSHQIGEAYNRNNERVRVIKEEGFVLINGEKTTTGKFESLTDTQLYQLVTAGVILLNDKQRNDFRRKFFSIDAHKNESDKKKK
ncbi:MAG: hypothetical protein ABI543_13205 [Ignavibacteria bacterium]